MSGFFYNLGRQLGQKAVPTIRKSKYIWDGVAGTEAEALRAEEVLGNDMAIELRAALKPLDDPQLAAWIQGLCEQLSARLRDKRRVFSCEVLCDPLPNAMALPGGFLFISHSLVELCERDPQQLAFVIGHEMAHVVRKHAWDRMINEAALRMASAVTARVGPLGEWLRQQGFALLRSAYDQDGECEADEMGLRLAAAAGFDPAGGITLLQRLQQLGPNETHLGHYFSSHPPISTRIARLAGLNRQLAARAGGSGQ